MMRTDQLPETRLALRLFSKIVGLRRRCSSQYQAGYQPSGQKSNFTNNIVLRSLVRLLISLLL